MMTFWTSDAPYRYEGADLRDKAILRSPRGSTQAAEYLDRLVDHCCALSVA